LIDTPEALEVGVVALSNGKKDITMDKPTPEQVYWSCGTLVVASTAVLPSIHGYGTNLYQFLVLGAYGIVAKVASDDYAELHHASVWALALVLNILLFAVPAGLFLLATRRRWPSVAVIGVAIWFAFYLGCLFFLFPATDGP
jgi:hypothetical protein